MTLSEAVKAAGIGGKIGRRILTWVVGRDFISLYGDGKDQIATAYETVTADDWTVVSRAPREWRVHVHSGIGPVVWLHTAYVGAGGDCCPEAPVNGREWVRVREVVEP